VSKNNTAPVAVVEWSPNVISWVDANHGLRSASSFADAAPNLPGKDVVVAVSRRSAFVRAYRVPNAAKADVRRILQVQIGQLFPVPANELAFDFHMTQEVNGEGRLAIVAAMRSSDLHQLLSQAKAAGLRVTRVVPASFGSPMLAKNLGFESAAVVHRTEEGLAIDLVAAGELRYSRVASLPAAALAIDMEVSRTFAAAVMSCAPTIAAGGLTIPDAEASTGGWALETLGTGHLDINLETEERLAARERGKQLQRLRLSLVIMGAALVVLTQQFFRYSDAEKLASAGDARWKGQINHLNKIASTENSKAADLNLVRTAIDRGFRPAQSVGDIITAATNAAPQGIWLTGISLERGKDLILRGIVTNGDGVSKYQRALADQDRFRNVTLVFAHNTEIDNTPVVQFSISAFPVGNLPLTDPNAKKGGVKK
jgi:Tfp pilus assembly protein PilN